MSSYIIQTVIDNAGVHQIQGRKAAEVVLSCPFCPARGYRATTTTLGVNIAEGKAHCFRCKWGLRGVLEIADALAKVYGVSYDRNLLRKRVVPDTVLPPEPPKVQLRIVAKQTLPEEYESFAQSKDFVGKLAFHYLLKRGISRLQILRHEIGFAAAGKMGWRVLFPVKDIEGNICGCVGRAIREETKPKYLNTPGLKGLWNGQRVAGTAYVCEGVMDALRVERILLSQGDATAVAFLGGGGISAVQMHALKRFERAVILPDWNQPGVAFATSIAEKCIEYHVDVKVAVPPVMNDADPGSLDEEVLREWMTSAIPWTRNTALRLRASIMRTAG